MKTTKILIVDDHKVVRDGLTAALSGVEKIQLIAEASSSQEMFAVLENQKPDIIFLDMFLPKPEGLEILRNLKKQYPRIKVMVISGNTEEDLVAGAFSEGAEAYLDKNIDKDELLDAIDTVMKNETYISGSIKNELSKKFISIAKYGNKYAHSKIASLSEKEIEVIRLFSAGFSYKEIANELGISVRTVETHRENILEKLELKTIIDVVKYAIKNKIVDL